MSLESYVRFARFVYATGRLRNTSNVSIKKEFLIDNWVTNLSKDLHLIATLDEFKRNFHFQREVFRETLGGSPRIADGIAKGARRRRSHALVLMIHGWCVLRCEST